MEQRNFLGTLGGSLELMGAGLSVFQPEWREIGLFLMVLGALPLLALAASYLPESAIPGRTLRRFLKGNRMGDEPKQGNIYNVTSHGSSGVTAGSIGTVNIGKLPFEMTQEVMAKIYSEIEASGLKAITLHAIGSERSLQACATLHRYLAARGISVTVGGRTIAVLPALPGPYEIRGDTIWVDADK